MNKLQKRLCKALYKENCWILVSASKRDMKETFGEIKVKAAITFFYDAGNKAAEWEPQYGPIETWKRCEENDEGAREHYYYDFTNSGFGNWSQLAVDTYELPQAFLDGDYDYIFNILKLWAEDR
jgi:hypothetical protein